MSVILETCYFHKVCRIPMLFLYVFTNFSSSLSECDNVHEKSHKRPPETYNQQEHLILKSKNSSM